MTTRQAQKLKPGDPVVSKFSWQNRFTKDKIYYVKQIHEYKDRYSIDLNGKYWIEFQLNDNGSTDDGIHAMYLKPVDKLGKILFGNKKCR